MINQLTFLIISVNKNIYKAFENKINGINGIKIEN